MSNSDEIRWHQRLEHFEKAFTELEEACELEDYSKLERAGLIQLFELTFEMAWKTLQDILHYEGEEGAGARTVVRKAHTSGFISDIDGWLAMLEDRNRASHAYDEDAVIATVEAINEHYQFLLRDLLIDLRKRRDAP